MMMVGAFPHKLSTWLRMGHRIAGRDNLSRVITPRSIKRLALFNEDGGLRGIKPLRKMITVLRSVLVQWPLQKGICIRMVPRALRIKTVDTAQTPIWQAP
jgi:hypothetical protein